MKNLSTLIPAILFLVLLCPSATGAEEGWQKAAVQLFQQAREQKDFAEADRLHPTYYPTSDGRSFILVWTPQKTPPQKWIVSLPGTKGFATRDLTIWHKYLQDRDIGVIDVQWWLGGGDKTSDYYSPFDIYREIDILLSRLNVEPGSAMLHGFSRGSANIYAVAALDRSRGRRYFSMFVAHAGGASMDYPPTRDVNTGVFGQKPFAGSSWVTVCGEKDSNPDRDGCGGMRRTGEWLRGMGGKVVLAIEDPTEGHGALHRNPENAKKLLNFFSEQHEQ